ncbi:copper transporter [Dethiobacter alkaliphilus]|uniref:Copper transporter n=1 Tax=Dethiobacter alkaliphilus AHT 1 TaxID=555088 RepID=C0GE12_DETAL|nr:copper transporter [Dethiobacter alkaliphilus]EEG78306.1 conserved hypothetical protein [Dethiobacter alkaliphilus AHT 1]
MFRFRDHIISLVAVFLALGLGILIGTGLSDDMLVTQQRLLIEQMARDQRSLREQAQAMEAKVQSLTRDLYWWEKYQEALYPNVVSGLLRDKPVSVIYHGTNLPQDVLGVLRDAEADVCSIIRVEGQEELAYAEGLGLALAMSLTEGNKHDKLDSYLAEGRIFLEYYSPNPPQAVILMLGEQEMVEKRLLEEMIETFNHEQVTLVGLEYSEVEDSVLESLKEAGLSTVDNVDTVFGQFSLLSVLRGSAGNYGIKSAADQFIADY